MCFSNCNETFMGELTFIRPGLSKNGFWLAFAEQP
jgi:hypothetical protein